MAIFQVATNTPPKSEIIADWICGQPWAGPSETPIEVVGSFHLEDPEGKVGMQVHIVDVAGALFQVPLTYRDERLPHREAAFMSAMEHSVLGTRFVYDGLGDEQFLSVMAGVAASGYGQTLGFAHTDGRWQAWPEAARVHSFGSVPGRVLVDQLESVPNDPTDVVMRNEDLELTIYRRLKTRPDPSIGMAATWPGQPDPMVLASIVDRRVAT